MSWGAYKFENNNWIKKPVGFEDIGGRLSRTPNPPDLSGGAMIVNINSDGRVLIEAISPIFNQRFAEIIIEQRPNSGYRNITNLVRILRNLQNNHPAITTERINALLQADTQGKISF
jgi:hypothetical protein